MSIEKGFYIPMSSTQAYAKDIIGDRMRASGMTAKDLSNATGFHHNTVLAWINGRNEPNYFNVKTCLDAMGYDIQITRK